METLRKIIAWLSQENEPFAGWNHDEQIEYLNDRCAP